MPVLYFVSQIKDFSGEIELYIMRGSELLYMKGKLSDIIEYDETNYESSSYMIRILRFARGRNRERVECTAGVKSTW